MYYSNFHESVMKIYRHEGARGFLKGVIPRSISIVPSIAISWCSYEMLKNMMRD